MSIAYTLLRFLVLVVQRQYFTLMILVLFSVTSIRLYQHECWSLLFGLKKFVSRDHCIIRHSLRYYRYSGLVIYKSKLPAPSVSIPCDCRILQSPTKGQVNLVFWEIVQWPLLDGIIDYDNKWAVSKLILTQPIYL